MSRDTAPITIEWASVPAMTLPSVDTVKQSVASATDGAAPNSPAKLFGLNRSEIRENTETTKPPIRKRRMISFKSPCSLAEGHADFNAGSVRHYPANPNLR